MSFAEQIMPIFRIALEVLREAGGPMQPGAVREAIAERVEIPRDLRRPDAHGEILWWTQVSFRTGEAASLGWMTKRNGWSITSIGIKALDDFPDISIYRELQRQYRERRLIRAGDFPNAFEQYQRNLGYARQLVHGGRNLERLGVAAFDVTDLYRAAWTQAVAALDHWVTQEIIDRAVALAQRPGSPRPNNFSRLSMPVELVEKVHRNAEPLEDAFRAALERFFEFKTFQHPDKIAEGFSHVSKVSLWTAVAGKLTDQDPSEPIAADRIRRKLAEIARRRNNIAHTGDHDPGSFHRKMRITAQETEQTIDVLESVVIAILQALGDLPPATDHSLPPAEAGSLGAAPVQPDAKRRGAIRALSRWTEESLLHALDEYCPPGVADTLLAVYRHAEGHPAFRGYYFGEAAHPSVTAWFSTGHDEAAMWSIYTGVSKSVLSINFEWMRNRGVPVDRLERLAHALSVLPGWASMPAQLSAANFARRPSLAPIALQRPDASTVVIGALNDLLNADTSPRAWLVRGGSEGEREVRALEEGLIIVGWHEVGDLSRYPTREALADALRNAFPADNPNTIANWMGQLWRFTTEIQPGDLVVMPLQSLPGRIAIGEVTGPYEHHPYEPADFRQVRKVTWLRRDAALEAVKDDLRASLNSMLTVCRLARNEAASRIATLAATGTDPGMTEEDAEMVPEPDGDPVV
ncbi:restriction endonuclease [Nonomuraea sp. AD125B]|uniref:restriction endonuclease n=1 Tax=Nonomuraea sp. AD125B TaxID=3242897 RepID=UPI003528518A